MKQKYIIHSFEVAENGMRVGATEITDIIHCNEPKDAYALGEIICNFHKEHDNKDYIFNVLDYENEEYVGY